MAAETAPPPVALAAGAVGKVRRRLLPFLFLLYIVSFLDRINIGFAALTMNRELAITSQQFGLLAGIFFFGYFVFEIPSNLILHRIGARRWIARILVTWGFVAALTALVHSVAQLYLLRFLLGVAEAGFFPGIILYLTYWFRQRDLAHAVALFMTAIAVSNIVGAPLSGLILDHIHWLGFSSWRWLLALEGLPAILCGVLTLRLLPDRPRDARFLAPEERDWLTAELGREERRKLDAHPSTVLQAIASRRVWHLTAVYFAMAVALYAVGIWLPQIVQSFSSRYSNTRIGLLVMLPHLAGLAAMVPISRRSDRTLERRYHCSLPAIVGGIALLCVGGAGSAWLSLVLLSVVVAGIYSFYGPFWALPTQFLTGFSAAAGIALVNSVGNLGGFLGPYVMGAIGKRTGSVRGGLLFSAASMLLAGILVILLPKTAGASPAEPSAGAGP
ncbi:MAG TPA: MFS transporter [Candidatus Acidoferrales bacterium]|nr:MFS transporter [Candidatus Acidoferrales bacterium]